MIELILSIGIIIVVILVICIISLRNIVPPNSADVVVNAKGERIYSGDVTVTKSKSSEPVYYKWPSWLPVIGVTVRRMPLNIMEIPIRNFETFAKGNPRFVVDVSVYCKITDVDEAARRFPSADDKSITESFRLEIQEVVISAVRTATATYNIEDIISKREELSNVVKTELVVDFKKWGCEITNVAFVSIRDPDDGSSTVVFDISNKKEAEINATSRMEVAARKKQAEIAEAEAYQASQTRKIEAEEQIGIRNQQKVMTIAEQEQMAVQKKMDVKRTEEIRFAEIEGDAKIKSAEREKQAMIELANGNRQKMELEGQGQAKNTELVGNAEAAVIKSKMVAEAEGLLEQAKAQEYQQDEAYNILELEVKRAIAEAYAAALGKADIQYIGSGEPEKFLDLFTPAGGLNIGGAIKSLSIATPEGATNTLNTVLTNVLGNSSPDNLVKLFDSLDDGEKRNLVASIIGFYKSDKLKDLS